MERNCGRNCLLGPKSIFDLENKRKRNQIAKMCTPAEFFKIVLAVDYLMHTNYKLCQIGSYTS
jgi:hypothetical protein